VKRAIETREELGDKIRQYSINQFHKSYTLPKDEEIKEKEFLSLDAVKTFKVGSAYFNVKNHIITYIHFYMNRLKINSW